MTDRVSSWSLYKQITLLSTSQTLEEPLSPVCKKRNPRFLGPCDGPWVIHGLITNNLLTSNSKFSEVSVGYWNLRNFLLGEMKNRDWFWDE